MKKKETILLINSSFFPNTGGVETTLLGMARDIIKNGEHVVVVTGNRTEENLKIDQNSAEVKNIQVFRYKNIGFFSYYFTCVFLLLKIQKELLNTAVHNFIKCASIKRREVCRCSPGILGGGVDSMVAFIKKWQGSVVR